MYHIFKLRSSLVEIEFPRHTLRCSCHHESITRWHVTLFDKGQLIYADFDLWHSVIKKLTLFLVTSYNVAHTIYILSQIPNIGWSSSVFSSFYTFIIISSTCHLHFIQCGFLQLRLCGRLLGLIFGIRVCDASLVLVLIQFLFRETRESCLRHCCAYIMSESSAEYESRRTIHDLIAKIVWNDMKRAGARRYDGHTMVQFRIKNNCSCIGYVDVRIIIKFWTVET